MTESHAATDLAGFDLETALPAWRSRADAAVAARLAPPLNATQRLHDAMQYAVSAGGKRMRPALIYATGETLGARDTALDAPAAAIEMIHAYSLVHDDLPAMDDDDLRRGQPTVHIRFDEATAILAGDALQANAFSVLATDVHNPERARLDMISCLAEHSGAVGMVGGQAIDLAAVDQTLDLAELQQMHRLKTGALINAAVTLGALAAGASPAALASLQHYSNALGLAFQIADDILDVTADTATLGKRQGADAAHGKPTYCSLLGVDGARDEARKAQHDGRAALDTLGHPAPALHALLEFAVARAY